MRRHYLQQVCISLILAVALVCSGCETYGGAAGLGAATGAIAGGIIGNQSGHSEGGALAGAALGALAGVIAHDIKVQRTRTASDTAYKYNRNPGQSGEMLQLESASVRPTVVFPGELAEASIEYALLGVRNTDVTETRILRQGGRLVSELSTQGYKRNEGTFVSSMPFRVPENLNPGMYSIETTVLTHASRIMGRADFEIRSR